MKLLGVFFHSGCVLWEAGCVLKGCIVDCRSSVERIQTTLVRDILDFCCQLGFLTLILPTKYASLWPSKLDHPLITRKYVLPGELVLYCDIRDNVLI